MNSILFLARTSYHAAKPVVKQVQHHVGINWPNVKIFSLYILGPFGIVVGLLLLILVLILGTALLLERLGDWKRCKIHKDYELESLRDFLGEVDLFRTIVCYIAFFWAILVWVAVVLSVIFFILRFFFWV